MVAIDLLDMAVLRLTLAPFQHHSLVRQEHGRTIRLAEWAGRGAQFRLMRCLTEIVSEPKILPPIDADEA
jgi:hypothetical protein